MTAFAELDLAARTEKLEKAVEEIRKIGREGEAAEKKVAKSTNAMEAGFSRLGAAAGIALGSVAAIFSAAQVWRGAQEVQAITNSFRGMGQSADEAQASLQAVADIAMATRAPLEATAQLYNRISIAAGELGATSGQVAQFTETVGMALAASGTSASQASGALMQLSQAMAGGTVRAEEFNSILEGAFPIAQAAARGIDAAGGSVGRLRQLVVDGKVSSEEFFNAILSQAPQIADAFEQTVPTVSQAMENLGTSISLAAAEMDRASGFSEMLAQGILSVSEVIGGLDMSYVVAGFEAFAVLVVGLATTQLPAAIAAIGAKVVALGAMTTAAGIATGAMAALNAALALLGGPIGIAVGTVTALGAAFLLTRDRASNLTGASDDLNAALKNVPGFADGAAGGVRRAGTAADTASGQFDGLKTSIDESRTALQSWMDKYMEAAALPPITLPLGATLTPPGELEDFLLGEINIPAPGEGGITSGRGTRPPPRAPSLLGEPGSAGAGGGGGGGEDPFQSRLDALVQYFETEQELVDTWYEESQAILSDRRAMEILGAEEHAALMLAVEEELVRRKQALRDQDLSHFESFFGSMAGAFASGGDKMLKISKAFGLAEAAVSIWRGAARALELPFPANLAAWGQVIATGAKALQGIRSASPGSSAGLGGGGGGGSRSATAEPAQAQNRFLRIEVNGEGMFAEALRDNVQSIADAITDLGGRGGTTIVVGR